MKQTKYLIIGGGIAGTNATAAIRQLDPDGSILLITAEKERLYSRVLLPNYLKQTLPLENVFLKKADFYDHHNIEFWSGQKVTQITPATKTVLTDAGETIQYEKLLLATGGAPNQLGVPKEDLPGIFVFKTIEDAQAIYKAMQVATAGVVVGGRFIALEFVTSFVKHGLPTTLLVQEDTLFQPFLDEEGGELVARIIKKAGTQVKFKEKTTAFLGSDRVELVVTARGEEIPADIVGVGVGITPQLDYLAGSSELVVNNHIQTDQYLQTTAPSVWAAGDVSRFLDLNSNRYHSLGNWANAADQGRIAGQNMAGVKTPFLATSSYAITFFDSSLAIIGDTSREYASAVVKRGTIAKEAYGNLYLKDDILIGAVLVGLAKDRGPLGNLIKNKVKITDRAKLEDVNFDLGRLLND